MAVKNLTKDCRKCTDFEASGPHGICLWGNSNRPKYLKPPGGRWRKCELIPVRDRG